MRRPDRAARASGAAARAGRSDGPLPDSVPRLIATKRDGGALCDADIARLIDGFVRGDVADYQMSALAMAIYFRGMSPEETLALTRAMRDSGRVLDLSSVRGRKVDKHSTGGVGDKLSLCLAPLVAATGVPVPMISGRGLGHTGGTLDKLEAIPGFSVDVSPARFVRQLRDVGCVLAGQSDALAPADRRLYALRDVTATVESVPLITASILSKKLAEGADALVLDVKVGRGAFMKREADAHALAASLVQVGEANGTRMRALLTDMDAPLGRTIGNALETAEAFEVLRGGGPDDVRELTLTLGAEMLVLAGRARSEASARRRLERLLGSGAAAEKMRAIVRAQGGDPRVVAEPDRLPRAAHEATVRAAEAGYVGDVDPLALGLASVALGAGRARADESVDPAAGLVLHHVRGDRVEAGAPLITMHAASGARIDAARGDVEAAVRISARPPKPRPLVLDRLGSA
ncbi:MAG: thymidine phosphorylase [Myxococcales bacterium]|nr:thymidine phosphorylase [Myxococcales bacterium]